MVGTFHTYSTSAFPNKLAANFLGARRLYSKLSARIAVSRPRGWTAQRYYGGRYRIVPNGVDLSAARPDHLRPNEELKILFVGRAEERKGLPVLLRAFEALRGAGVEARLTVAGPAVEEVEPLLLDPRAWRSPGRWTRPRNGACWARPTCSARPRSAARASAWCSRRRSPRAPGGGVGHRRLPRRGARRQDSVLVPVGDAVALGETLRSLAFDPDRRAAMAEAASERAERFAWPNVTREVVDVYEEALSVPQPEGRMARLAQRTGVRRRSPARACRRSVWPRSSPRNVRRPPTRRAPPGAWSWLRVPCRASGWHCWRSPARDRVDRTRDRGRHAGLGARGLRAHVRLDAAARRGVERNPARRAAGHPRAAATRRAAR